ncbi:hypothetical protein Poli38472_005444 [Pythium oligandrum]|uniref:Uncharacterized protein n=1 Tax=Pythium oligandrum TaxID=41045 RepID=A0A8K1CG06_PYTOL|nr:hypothetical protein Poli38472_005444 [Pythium oligandrum]|eukprot:TMW62826.1 hypothetical protein Poli38472_005444 [Pythium oligandrum]
MKRTLEHVNNPASDLDTDDEFSFPRTSTRRLSSGLLKRERRALRSGSNVSQGALSPSSFARIRRRTCDLEFHLREEGLIRWIFSFMDVREHQLLKSCCRSWMKIIQAMSVDNLDLSIRSPITSVTVDRAFLSVIHSYGSVRRIDFTGQRSLSDRDLLVLTSCYWPNLEHIIVDDCLEISDFGLLSILNAQSQLLHTISMRHCKHITGSFGPDKINGRHPSLQVLDFSDTRISHTIVHGLENKFPSLQQIHAMHTPAHFDFFHHMHWDDLLEELDFLVSNELSDLPHLTALQEEFVSRAARWLQSQVSNKKSISVFYGTLLSYGKAALVNAPLHRGDYMSALLMACENGLTNIVPSLVVEGNAWVELTDKDNASALGIAATNGLTDVVRLLLEAGADINKRTHCLATPLYIATEMNWDDVIDVLLTSNAQTTCSVVGGATALCVAAKNGNHKTVLRLLGAERSTRRSNTASARQLLQHTQALFLACERGYEDIVRDILNLTDAHANVLMDNSVTPLYLACQMGHERVVALLLECGANPNFRRPNAGGVSCLYIAAQEGKVSIVDLLVRHKVNVHARMEDLSTALHIAARMGHTAVAHLLLREGACINDQTRSGLTPLYIACEEGHLPMVEFFVANGANLNLQTRNGTTSLFVASQKGHTQVVRVLLLAGANAHLPKNNGTYPMDAASLLGNYEVTKLLLQFGARVGGLSLHFAERRRDLQLQTLLMDRYYEQHSQRASDRPTGVLS